MARKGDGTDYLRSGIAPITRYDERGASGPVLRRNDFAYAQDANGMPYTSGVTTTIDVGTSSQMVTKTEQTLDVYGNATQTRLYAFNSLSTPVKTINCTYWNPGINPLQIRNRLSSCSATQGSETRTMVGLGYDGPLAGWTAGGVPQHDTANFGVSFTTRGNVTGAWSYGGRTTGMQYNILGEVVRTTVGGTTLDTTYNASNNWVAPVAMTPNSNSAMQTTLGWNSWFAPTTRYGANGASESVAYDAVGRPTGSNNADGTW